MHENLSKPQVITRDMSDIAWSDQLISHTCISRFRLSLDRFLLWSTHPLTPTI